MGDVDAAARHLEMIVALALLTAYLFPAMPRSAPAAVPEPPPISPELQDRMALNLALLDMVRHG